ncbi:hypothetical protein DPEC_G00071050 [Dallia pectoralis]|uniref:Uncharacterized protein n=1 Tax=Dallia pectoralis TaxID=75939 RepID=A0ACC2H300_DALPE|nr:hypothetical protein DPEC_G00071050 [Dallia pectoralis]
MQKIWRARSWLIASADYISGSWLQASGITDTSGAGLSPIAQLTHSMSDAEIIWTCERIPLDHLKCRPASPAARDSLAGLRLITLAWADSVQAGGGGMFPAVTSRAPLSKACRDYIRLDCKACLSHEHGHSLCLAMLPFPGQR